MSGQAGGVPRAINHDSSQTTFDIVAIPAIGADAWTTWSFSKGQAVSNVGSWDSRSTTTGLSLSTRSSMFSKLVSARVYLYEHPPLEQWIQHGIPYYARSLLQYLLSLPDLGSRPISFVAHSTGGLVIKSALAKAFVDSDESHGCWDLVRRCFSMGFFGVPHYGSTILSEDGPQDSVAAILSLSNPMSSLLRQELSPDNIDELERSSRDFVAISNRLKKIWTFVEGEETTVFPDSDTSVRSPPFPGKQKTRVTTFFKTPIVDRRSATLTTPELEFGVEEVIIVNARHAHLATFGDSPDSAVLNRFVQDLTNLAQGLSGDEAKDLEKLANSIKTDIHLFYEGSQLGSRTSIKLWSRYPKLSDLCEKGPTRCLEERYRNLRVASLPAQSIELEKQGETLTVPKTTWTASIPQKEHFGPRMMSRASGPSVPEISIEFVDDDKIATKIPDEGEDFGSIPEAPPLEDSSPPSPSDLFSDPFVSQTLDPINNGRSGNPGYGIIAKPDSAAQQLMDTRGTVINKDVDPRTASERKLNMEPETERSSRSRIADSLLQDRRRSVSTGRRMTDNPPIQPARRADTLDLVFTEFDHKKKKRWGSISDAVVAIKNVAKSSGSNAPTVLDTETFPIDRTRYDENPPQQWAKVKKALRDKAIADATLPSKDRIKFRWIHIPMNNMLWAPAIFRSLAAELRQPSLERVLLHRQHWNALQHVPRHKSPHGRFMSPSCIGIFPEDKSILQPDPGLQSPTIDIQMSLFFPYLHWDTFLDLQLRGRLIERRGKQDRAYPLEEKIHDECSEHQLIWWHLSNASDLPLHIRRSLDQYGYPNLANTKARDMDQVLYKRTRSQAWTEVPQAGEVDSARKDYSSLHRIQRPRGVATRIGDQDDESSVLMVDSLWLWVTDASSVVTFYPSRKDGHSCLRQPQDNRHKAADIRDNVYNDVVGDPQFARQCSNCFEFAALSVLHATTALLESTDDQDLQVFRIFEEYLSLLTERQTKSFKEFRDSQLVENALEDEQSIRNMLTSLHNREDLTDLLELRDIEDELKTLDKLFTEQVKVIEQMQKVYQRVYAHLGNNGPTQKDTSEGPRTSNSDVRGTSPIEVHRRNLQHSQEKSTCWLHEAKEYILRYTEQSQDMQRRCESVQEAYKLLLDMKQKQANVAEASLSRIAAQVASEQNRAIMIFTIFTIIFLPLSFFTSLFGMNVRQWSGVDSNPSSHAIFLTGGLVSVAIIVVALTLAFNRPIRHMVIQVFYKISSLKPVKRLKVTWRKILGPCFGSTRRPPPPSKDQTRWDDVEKGQGNARRDFEPSLNREYRKAEKSTNPFVQTKIGLD